ncbi:MAG: DHA2 family efflux MFS transporter permease subunit [Chlamydiales bacterium]|nr:DHA2 family efflux MFS transporter permease subunit [Chlamydiales bacterium]
MDRVKPSTTQLTNTHLFLLCISIGLATFLDVLDLAITNVALPDITGSLGESPFNGAWVISSYAIGSAIIIPISGYLSNRFGEVKVFTTSILFFIITSAACGFASNFYMLVFFRVLQGVCAGPLMPLSQSLLLANFPEAKKGIAIALWSMIAVAGPILGPILGGLITDTIGWRWIFYINLPIGILSLFMNLVLLRHHKTKIIKNPIDITALILLVLGVASLQLFLDQGNDDGWFQSNAIILLFCVGVITLALFIIWTLTSKKPIIDLTLYKMRNFLLMNIVTLLTYVAIYGSIIIYPLWLETQLGYNAFWTGLAIMPSALFILFGAPIIGLFTSKVDLRILMTLSCIFFVIAAYTASLYNTEASFTSLLPPRIMLGIAISFTIAPTTIIAVSNIAKDRLPNAMSLLSFFRVLGAAIGSSIGVAVFQIREKFHYHNLKGSINNSNSQVDATLNTLKDAGMPGNSGLEWIYNQTIKQAYTLAINDYFMLVMFSFVLIAIIIWLTKPTDNTHTALPLE